MGVSAALAGPVFPYPYAPKSTWSNVSLAGVIGVIVAVTILALVMVISALLTRQQVAPVLADVTPIAATSDANASGETRKAA